MIQPAFHKRKLQGLLQIMYQAIKGELSKIKAGEIQDIYPLMGDLAFQVVATSLFSRDDIQVQMSALKEITEANQRMLIQEMRQPYLNWWYKFSGKINRHIKLSLKARAILSSIIKERLAQDSEKDDLMDMLLKATYEDGSRMPEKQLIDEILILFAAGHETTANALGFILFLLAKHPEKQEKAFAEINAIDWTEGIEMESLRKLGYVKQCIEEGMRLYPPAYYIDRESIIKDEIEDYEIPENSMLLLAIYELHRDSRFWESPNAFKPERFDPANKRDYSDYYFPFGGGPRMCIGNNFAMQEMILTVAEILRSYTLRPVDDEVLINPLISLKPVSVKLHFIPR
jgi:cytochrome P450